jgi:NADPH:quinone reductase-like Zn-dependent oxidoreductase
VPADGIMLPMPESMSFEEATTYCDGPLTSINFLKDIAKIKSGQKVLVNGASGALGTAAVQLAKYYGAEVTGVCSGRNFGLVKSLGADHVIDYTQEDFTKSDQTYDIIYDTVGRSSFGKCKKVLSEKGLFVTPVLSFRGLLDMIATSISGKKKSIFAASGVKKESELKRLLGELTEIFKAGKLKTVIDRQYPLEKVAQAHAYIDGGHKKGNIVINVNL